MKKFVIYICLSLMFSSLAFSQSQIGLDKIKQINLLETNRDDVRRILASYKLDADDENHNDSFSLGDAEIRVDYSEGTCEETGSDGFEVPEWKVIYINIELSNPISPKELRIDLSKYKKEQRYFDSDDTFVYYDKEVGVIFNVYSDKIDTIEFVPSSKHYNLMCDKEKAKKLSSTLSIFEQDLKERSGTINCPVAEVSELNLSRIEIEASCNSSDSTVGKTCSESAKTIDIYTKTINEDRDVLVYDYFVSGGKIVGTGEKVVWDLNGVKPGTYKITAAVDDGCGFCGRTQTKSIVVRECSKCN